MFSESQDMRLTRLAHGGGCGCKLAPGVLESLLADTVKGLVPPDLLVGNESRDDAAVYKLSDEHAIVATTDFFMPIVDNPFHFGAIAATNALSDVYAMGGKPLFALALVAMPIDKLAPEVIREILAGGESVCRAAGIPIAGGHSIDSVEPIYGLVAIGSIHPGRVKRNDAARAGDVLILGKALGVGIHSAALRENKLEPAVYDIMIASTTQLNTPGTPLGLMDDVHAITDVTGFGLLGHLLELCRGSGLHARLDWNSIPLLPHVLELAEAGFVTGASKRNWKSYGADVDLGAHSEIHKWLLTDPQTSGGLLVSCAPDAADEVLSIFRKEGFASAAVIGRLEAGKAGVVVQ
ncbi:MAG: selenide, water dikinase SelD [Calditrichaeota bacterium]|nr:selenide, water dikinase SelD [Candidatus Cloacimonadota bacterium]MCB1046462.1 selenide, water dikinase SelD [Calditrichota bacterium]MCB9474878.1 selenide, water dikinase SelD [Candidatus Delongbacteria bacterium]